MLKKPDSHPRIRNKLKAPRGMYLNYDDLMAIATGPPGQGEAILKQLDAELVSLKRHVSGCLLANVFCALYDSLETVTT